jgi:integrase
MSEKRVTVWVQRFKDRSTLVLQWIDPETGQRKSKSAGTADPDQADKARADLEYELTHGKYLEASRMTWERFREVFESEYLTGCRPGTRKCYGNTLDWFEELCKPGALRSVNERTISRFVGELRKQPFRGREGHMASTIKVKLEHLHKAMQWAMDQSLIAKVPKFPVVKVPRKVPQPVPVESFEKLLDKARDQQMKTYLLCGWLAGLRLTEALELEREPSSRFPWVDWSRDRLILPAEFVKGDADQWVPLDPQLRAALEVLPGHGRKVFHFTDQAGRKIAAVGVSSRVIRLAKACGVRLTMKILRRGFGCRYAGKVSAHVLQRLMRHSNINITMAYYANIDTAVEEAVLGPQRNGLRNKPHETAISHGGEVDANDCCATDNVFESP